VRFILLILLERGTRIVDAMEKAGKTKIALPTYFFDFVGVNADFEKETPNQIDALVACGLLMGDNWMDKRIVTVNLLGPDFLDTVKTGDPIKILEHGTVEIQG
jgi:hypothetical protein